jgi:hypothetical protein
MKKILSCSLAVILPCILLAEKHSASPSALDHSSQLIVVTTPDWNTVDGSLQRYQRPTPAAPWKAVGPPVSVVVGKKGLGWGIGVMPVDAVRGIDDPIKREGDLKSPAGIFRLGSAFGYAPQEPGSWKIPYLAITPSTDCVDDPQSRHYNSILDRSTLSPDWNSAEHMREAGEAYRWGIVIEHNAAPPKSGAGSCVFMHIWDRAGIGTAGCTAMPEPSIESILAWLNPAAKPLLVQMPVRQYRQLRTSLHLP